MEAALTTQTTGEFQTLATDDPLVAEQRSMLDPGTVLAGRYRIQELIGEGGMGDVYLAEHNTIGKLMAIKVLAPQQMRRPRTVSRFLQEAKAASKIRHENVVDITDYGESDGCAFFVMEYLRGEDLSVLLKREGRQPWSRIKPICIQVLKALSAAHAAGVVHRDIKPHNCFVTARDDGSEQIKVIDFGIAKLSEGSEEQLTRTGAIMGTAEYMSPEQGMGSELDGRSDLYSVGVILYRMLTGAVPYRGNNPMAILYQHIHSDRVPPSEACPEAGIGAEVDALVVKALSQERDARFASAEEFIAAIDAIDEVGTGGAAAPSASPRRWMVIGGAAVAAVLLGVVGMTMLGGDESDPGASKSPGLAGAASSVNPTSPSDTTPVVDSTVPSAVGSTGESTGAAEPSPAGAEATGSTGAALEQGDSDESGAPVEVGADDGSSTEPARPATSLPARRTVREIRSRLGRVSGKVKACGKKAGLFPGESVSVRLKIAASGRVQSAKVQGAFSRKGASCIESVVRGTRFSAVRQAQTADHRFTL